jgi:undecaprenyl-diphosphatase
MTFFHLFLLAVIQGITEFLPVSSSGHLILLPQLTGFDDQGLVIDVAVHVGTLGAVSLYFRKDLMAALRGVPEVLRLQVTTREGYLALCLMVATVPVMAAGLVLKVFGLTEMLRSVALIGWMMIIFGIVLYWADTRAPETRKAEEWTLKHAVIFGLWQVIALLPGTSRSGIVITGARALGYKREDAARLSMLMSIPTIIASAALMGADVVRVADWQAAQDGAIAAVISFFAALAALALMMRLLKFASFTPYVIYRIALGVVLLWIAYS